MEVCRWVRMDGEGEENRMKVWEEERHIFVPAKMDQLCQQPGWYPEGTPEPKCFC